MCCCCCARDNTERISDDGDDCELITSFGQRREREIPYVARASELGRETGRMWSELVNKVFINMLNGQ